MRPFVSSHWASMVLLLAIALGLGHPPAIAEDIRDRALEVLRSGFSSEEFWPSMHAAEGLSAAEQQNEVTQTLVKRLARNTDDQHRCGLARELVRVGDRSYVTILFDILSDEQSNGRTHAAESLFKVAEIGDGIRLRAAMADDDLRQSLMAAAALARCGSPAALEHIRAQLNHADPAIRMIVPWILRQVGDASDIKPLRAMLNKEHDPLIRGQCVHALALLGEPAAQGQLLVNLSAKDSTIRVYAAEAAAGLKSSEKLQAALVGLLDDDVLDVRIRAAHALLVLETSQGSPPRGSEIARTVYEATETNPRWSEGSILPLRNGRLLFAITRFVGVADAAHADIVARESSDGGRTWGDIRLLQENIGQRNVMSVTLRRLDPARVADGPIGMFYLVKNGDTDLNVFLRASEDEGQTFGTPIPVTDRTGYHVLNNDRVTLLRGGRLLVPVSATSDQSRENHYRSFCFFSDDGGHHWQVGRGKVDLPKRGAMEPEVIELTDGGVLMIVRSQLGRIYAAHSSDAGETWSAPEPWGPPAPEAPSTLRRIPATGDLVLVWNNHVDPAHHHSGQRTPLSIAVSTDEGQSWSPPRNLESDPEETYAYTSLTFFKDRMLLSYYVEHDGQYSTRFRSLPVAWLYTPVD